MVRFEENKLIIEIEDNAPVETLMQIQKTLAYFIGAFDADKICESENSIAYIAMLLRETLPTHEQIQAMVSMELKKAS